MRVSYLKCDRCGKVYDEKDQMKIHQDGKDFVVNSFRLGNWDQRNKRWVNITSGYDLCAKCAGEIADVIFAGAENPLKMRFVTKDQYRSSKGETLEESQESFAKQQEDGDDGK